MVRVLRDFRRRRISAATRHRRAAEWGGRQAVIKRSSSGRHVSGKAVGWELQAHTSFQLELAAEQAQQK
eukprot:13523883-Heterocapsa_arctica.AAC.1